MYNVSSIPSIDDLITTIPTEDKLIWEHFFSQFRLFILSTCDELNIFSAINSGANNLKSLAEATKLEPKATQVLVNYLIHAKFLINNFSGYELSSISSDYLLPSSPFYWGSVLNSLRQHQTHLRIINGLRANSNLIFNGVSLSTMWKEGNITPDVSAEFTQRMHCMSFAPAIHAVNKNLFKDTQKLLDIGAGSGCFGLAYLNQNPDKHYGVFDLSEVVEISRDYLKNIPHQSHISFHSGNFFTDQWPDQYDGILFGNILHDWDENTAEQLIEKAYTTLPHGGRLYIHEMIYNAEGLDNVMTACFDLLMYINHGSQQFSLNSIKNILARNGFSQITVTQSSSMYCLINAVKE